MCSKNLTFVPTLWKDKWPEKKLWILRWPNKFSHYVKLDNQGLVVNLMQFFLSCSAEEVEKNRFWQRQEKNQYVWVCQMMLYFSLWYKICFSNNFCSFLIFFTILFWLIFICWSYISDVCFLKKFNQYHWCL